jgi:signal transduction histidine kinase
MSNVEGRLRNQSAMLAAIAHDLRHALFRVGLSADLVRDERDDLARARSLTTIQALSNLVGNALCHTPTGGLVMIGAMPDEDSVRFTVSDTGAGIRAADLPHLFERYGRGGKAAYAGRGLGLAIAHGLVEQHGGTIWAENLPDGGASFSFTIPCA